MKWYKSSVNSKNHNSIIDIVINSDGDIYVNNQGYTSQSRTVCLIDSDNFIVENMRISDETFKNVHFMESDKPNWINKK